MEKNLASICRDNPLELDGSALLDLKGAVYTLCLEDLFLRAVPNTLILFFILSNLCPLLAQLPSTLTALQPRIKSALILGGFLSALPILELLMIRHSHSTGFVSLYYFSTESSAWLLASFLLYIETLKKVKRSLILPLFWTVSLVSSSVKLISRISIEDQYGELSYALIPHILETASILGVLILMIPSFSHKRRIETNTSIIGVSALFITVQAFWGISLILIPIDFESSVFSLAFLFAIFGGAIAVGSPMARVTSVSII